MEKSIRKPFKGFVAQLIITIVLLFLFVALFLTACFFISQADPAIKDFGDMMQYHINGFVDIIFLRLNNNDNIVYYTLSRVFYAFVFLWIVFLVVGITIAKKYKRSVMVFGIISTFLNLFVFIILATGLPKYWLAINSHEPFANNESASQSTVGLLIAGILYALASLLTYLACVLESFRSIPQEKDDEDVTETKKEANEEPAKEVTLQETVKEEFQEEPEPEPVIEEEPQEEKNEHLSNKELLELIRTIVKEEVSNRAPQGPLVVQYFGTTPFSQETPKQDHKEEAPLPKEEPVAEVKPSDEVKVHENIVPEEEKAPEYVIVPEEKEEPAPTKEEPLLESEPEPIPEPAVELPEEEHVSKKIIRIPFQVRMINADEEMKKNYNELKNEILSYGVNSRVSNSGDAFRLHRKTYVKITIAGLSLKLYFALNPDDYKDSPIPVQNAGHKGIYAEIPLVFKVKSGLSMRRCKELIQTVMEKDGFEQGPIEEIDWVEKLKEAPVDDDESNED